MRGKIRLIALLLCLLFLSACAAPVPVQNKTDPRVLQEARGQYRNSSLIVRGVCVQTHIGTDGSMCYDLEITEIIAGEAKIGDLIHCKKEMTQGGEYILYLSEGEDVIHAEDMAGFTLQAGPLPIKEDTVQWDASGISLSELMQDIEEMRSVIVAPAKTYYHNELAELVSAADEIFIGRVDELPPMKELPFNTREEGVSTESSPLAAIVSVQAYGSVKGTVNYGDTLELVYSRETTANILDAGTLTAHSEMRPAPLLREDELYVFFLNYGPDPKQPYLFPVNIYQGYVHLSGDALYVSETNTALREYRSLIPLVQDMRKAFEN